jgi:SseB protein C-terminal domain/SseB protein N-terminal domain
MTAEFIPTNELEEVYLAAVKDPTERPHFCRMLLESDIFFLVFYDEIGIRIMPVKRNDGVEVIPIFSSLARLKEFASGVGLQEYKYEQSTGREILTIVATADVILNPTSGYAKQFDPSVIGGMLDGSEMKRLKIITIDESQTALCSQPATYPAELVDDLKASFAFGNSVKKAYLAQVHQERHQHPQLVIGIEADESLELSEAMEIAMESLAEDEFITFFRLGTDPLSDYLVEQTQPFYVRAEDGAKAL